MWPMNHVLDGAAHWRHMTNTMDRSVRRQRFGLSIPLLQKPVYKLLLCVDSMHQWIQFLSQQQQRQLSVFPVQCHVSNRTSLIHKIQHSRTAAVYARSLQWTTRSAKGLYPEKNLLAKLRSDHCVHVHAYEHFDGQLKLGPGTADAGTLARLPWYSTFYQIDCKFSVLLKHFLYLHPQLLRANRSHWHDVLFDGLVRIRHQQQE